jgi:hypothetical protein
MSARSAAFVRNDTMMFVGFVDVENGAFPLIIYNVSLTTNTYIPLNITYPPTFSSI